MIDANKVVCGGQTDETSCRIAPTVMDGVMAEDAVMGEEIFGPLLPVLTFDSFDQVVYGLQNKAKPLAMYLFSSNKNHIDQYRRELSFGGGCINDTIIHLATPYLGFGGVSNSGMGTYHGKKSFDTFTHEKSIIKKSDKIDIPIRYMPYNKAKEQLMKFFLKL